MSGKRQKEEEEEKPRDVVTEDVLDIYLLRFLNRRVAKRSHPTPDPLAEPPFTRRLLSVWTLFHIVLFLASAHTAAFLQG